MAIKIIWFDTVELFYLGCRSIRGVLIEGWNDSCLQWDRASMIYQNFQLHSAKDGALFHQNYCHQNNCCFRYKMVLKIIPKSVVLSRLFDQYRIDMKCEFLTSWMKSSKIDSEKDRKEKTHSMYFSFKMK